MPRFSAFAGRGLSALVFCAGGFALEPTVTSVEISGGRSTHSLETREGEALDPAKLRSDVKTLWNSGRFADVRVETVEEGESVSVLFRVQPKQLFRLRRVEVKPPTPGVNVQVPPKTEIDPFRAQQIGDSVRKQLEGSGHPFAKVETKLLPAGNGVADLEVLIDTGKQIDIQEVALAGDLGAPGQSARKALKWTSGKTMIPGIWRIRPGYSENAAQYDAANLRSFYYQRGYFDADVKPAPVDLSGSKVNLRFDVQSGPRYAIRNFTLAGADGERSILPRTSNAFPVRDICNALFEERRNAERSGILDFAPRVEVRDISGQPAPQDADKWADLTATIERGPKYRIGRIEFRGNHTIGDTIIRRTLLINESEPLDSMLLRKSLARLNSTGFFEPLTQSSVTVNTPPGATHANVLIQLQEKKMRHWYFSGPVGPMSIGGPLSLKIGSRLPPWGARALELATYTASFNLMLFAKPLGQILPGFPNKRLVPLLTIARPPLPGQRLLSGFVIAPQLGWQGMLTGYVLSQGHSLLGGVFESDRSYTPALPVTIVHGGREGTLYCEPQKTKLDWAKQIGGTATNVLFSFSPF